MLRVCNSSIIVKLSICGVSLILTDVRFGSFSQNLVTNRDFQLNEIFKIPCIHWYEKYVAIFQSRFSTNPTSIGGSYQNIYKQKKLTVC